MRIMFDEVRGNKFKSVLLMSFFIIIIGVLGAVLGMYYGNLYFGVVVAVLFPIMYSLIGMYSGDKMILSMSGAREVTKKEFPYLFHTVEGLAIAARIPTPKAYVIDDTALNAFATGRDPKHASITVTTGLLKKLNRQELEGVVGHEMSHIKNFDIRFMM
ncbi:M48 family metalloprotease, partial [Candidatus Woesearchaeota archaeon]|nr:M48 family metalloprotease [Candidatus Woesearchaeota archaeon]